MGETPTLYFCKQAEISLSYYQKRKRVFYGKEKNYYLEVSSPGMDRPLIKTDHYERYVGEEIEIKLYKGKNGTKSIQGVLGGIDGDVITVTDHDGKECKLRLSEIAKANLAVVF